jgi:DNA-binding NarL/FixJ family response regulator
MAGPTTTRLHVLVVDDSEDYQQAMSRLLATYPCVATVRQALSGSEALAEIAVHRTDLMLIDIAMPDVNGLDLTRSVKALRYPPKIIVVTLYDTPTYREAAKAAGADGFLGKSQLGDGLQRAITEIYPEACEVCAVAGAR